MESTDFMAPFVQTAALRRTPPEAARHLGKSFNGPASPTGKGWRHSAACLFECSAGRRVLAQFRGRKTCADDGGVVRLGYRPFSYEIESSIPIHGQSVTFRWPRSRRRRKYQYANFPICLISPSLPA